MQLRFIHQRLNLLLTRLTGYNQREWIFFATTITARICLIGTTGVILAGILEATEEKLV